MKNIVLEGSDQHLFSDEYECQHCYETVDPKNAYTDALLPLDECEEHNTENAYVLCGSCVGEVVCHAGSLQDEWKRLSDLKLAIDMQTAGV